MKEYKLAFKCKTCGAKLQMAVKEGMFGKTSTLRCKSCGEITSVKVPIEQVFIDHEKKKDINKDSDSPKTDIRNHFSQEQFIRLSMIAKPGDSIATDNFDIDQQQMIIGRKNTAGPLSKPDIEIANDDRFMSKKHAVILRKENKSYVIKDLNSTNGTWVNGEKLQPDDEIYLEQGDELKLGRTLFRIQIL